MADHAGPGSAVRPVQAVPPRQLAVPWIAVAALAAVAWGVTVVLARTMGNGPGTMGLALLPFLGLWVVMMAAMMLPSVAPVAVLWTRLIAGAPAGPGRPLRMSAFLAGYLLAWAVAGTVAFAALAGTGRLLGEPNVTEMVTCIRLCLDCVDICAATAGVIGRQTDYDATVAQPLLEACVAICKSCGDECERHAHMPHCRVCAEACRRCEQACRDLLDAAK